VTSSPLVVNVLAERPAASSRPQPLTPSPGLPGVGVERLLTPHGRLVHLLVAGQPSLQTATGPDRLLVDPVRLAGGPCRVPPRPVLTESPVPLPHLATVSARRPAGDRLFPAGAADGRRPVIRLAARLSWGIRPVGGGNDCGNRGSGAAGVGGHRCVPPRRTRPRRELAHQAYTEGRLTKDGADARGGAGHDRATFAELTRSSSTCPAGGRLPCRRWPRPQRLRPTRWPSTSLICGIASSCSGRSPRSRRGVRPHGPHRSAGRGTGRGMAQTGPSWAWIGVGFTALVVIAAIRLTWPCRGSGSAAEALSRPVAR